jgi:hypothetical protein
MTTRHHQRADKLVAEFREILGAETCAGISDAHFQGLTRWCAMPSRTSCLMRRNAWRR